MWLIDWATNERGCVLAGTIDDQIVPSMSRSTHIPASDKMMACVKLNAKMAVMGYPIKFRLTKEGGARIIESMGLVQAQAYRSFVSIAILHTSEYGCGKVIAQLFCLVVRGWPAWPGAVGMGEPMI